ncbi:MAG: hypothetical protein ACK4VI_03385 [Alphaproteobacteria bacterium]
MAISANPLQIVGSTPVLSAVFARAGLDQGTPINLHGAANGNQDEALLAAPSLRPDQISVKTRVMNLIHNGNPEKAVNLMQSIANEQPDLFDEIAADVMDDLKSSGYKEHAEIVQKLGVDTDPDPIVVKPRENPAMTWTFG